MSAPEPSRTPHAGGFFLAVSIIAGVIIGSILGEPSMGFLGGTGVGLVLLGLVWLIDRRK